MPITKPQISKDEQLKLVAHMLKHKTYPYKFQWNRAINNTTFNVATGNGVRNFTLTFRVNEVTPIISLATNFVVTPNTTVGIFGITVSYKPLLSFADNASATVPDDEGGDIYQLISNGGAINDFQVFYPLNWYMDRTSQVYVHVFADTTTCTAGTSTMAGQIIFGTLPPGA